MSSEGASVDLYRCKGSESGSQVCSGAEDLVIDEAERRNITSNSAKAECQARGVPLANSGFLTFKSLETKAGGTIFEQDLAQDEVKQGDQTPRSNMRSNMQPNLGRHGHTKGGSKGGEVTPGVLKYALHLRFMCPHLRNHGKEKVSSIQSRSISPNCVGSVEVEEERRFYLYGDLRVVFPQRHADADEGQVIVFSVILCCLLNLTLCHELCFLFGDHHGFGCHLGSACFGAKSGLVSTCSILKRNRFLMC